MMKNDTPGGIFVVCLCPFIDKQTVTEDMINCFEIFDKWGRLVLLLIPTTQMLVVLREILVSRF